MGADIKTVRLGTGKRWKPEPAGQMCGASIKVVDKIRYLLTLSASAFGRVRAIRLVIEPQEGGSRQNRKRCGRSQRSSSLQVLPVCRLSHKRRTIQQELRNTRWDSS